MWDIIPLVLCGIVILCREGWRRRGFSSNYFGISCFFSSKISPPPCMCVHAAAGGLVQQLPERSCLQPITSLDGRGCSQSRVWASVRPRSCWSAARLSQIYSYSLSTPAAQMQVPPQTLLPPPKKEVMFLVRSVCLSVCLSVRRITRKLVNGF